MSSAMDLTERQLEQIGSYVQQNLGTWIRVVDPPLTIRMEPHYLERMIRIEEELRTQRELLVQGFAAMEKRFEQVDKRFEQVDKRFEETRADTNARFAQVDKRFEEMRADSNARFAQVDKRFEEMRADSNARFEETRATMDARFEDARHHTNVWMTALMIVVAISGIAGPIIATVIAG